MIDLSLKQKRALWAYSGLWCFLSPFYAIKLWWRGRKEPLYRQHIAERFGFYGATPAAAAGPYIWVHAVSLGEARAAAVLVDALREQIPDMRLLLTHGTATGRGQGQAVLREGDTQCWLPIDTPGSVRRFLKHFRPRVGLLIETEIWPNLMRQAQKQHVPMIQVNARLSRRNLEGVKKVQALLGPAYQALSAVLAQSDDDAKRLLKAGAPVVKVLGNLKFDMQPDATLLASGRQRKARENRLVVMAASTRDGEEAELLQAWGLLARQVSSKMPFEISSKGPSDTPSDQLPAQLPVLLIVPRHPQRFNTVARLAREAGFSVSCRSIWSEPAAFPNEATPVATLPEAGGSAKDASLPENAQVWIGDTVGEMPFYYGLSDIVLLGGSFKRYGGQNLLEALACGCPVITGQHTYNFSLASAMANEAGVAYRVGSFAQAVEIAQELLSHPEQLSSLKEKSVAFIEANQGASNHMAAYIAGLDRDCAN